MQKTCFNCGSTIDLTRDHIPPDNLFVPPLPSNLITVDCCRPCNSGFSMDDEAFMIFASMTRVRSENGERIWKKALNSSLKNSPKLKENIIKSLVEVKDPETGEIMTGVTIPDKRVNNYLIRVTKGLIRNFHPELATGNSKFEVIMLNKNTDVTNALSKFVYDERGNGTFRFWRAFINNPVDLKSAWVYMFFDGLMFMVEEI